MYEIAEVPGIAQIILIYFKKHSNRVREMRNATLKYAGIVCAIIGTLILITVGFFYVWADWATYWVDVDAYKMPFGVGLLLFGSGLLAYIFIEE
jgi:hypothetical protein